MVPRYTRKNRAKNMSYFRRFGVKKLRHSETISHENCYLHCSMCPREIFDNSVGALLNELRPTASHGTHYALLYVHRAGIGRCLHNVTRMVQTPLSSLIVVRLLL